MNVPVDVPPPLFSIVTVARNATETIDKVIRSVAEQDLRDFEWIVIDGASTDGTVEKLTAHRDAMTFFVSEPDGGIYDAMNKGIAASRGEWVFFLNADDRFTDAKVLSDVATSLSSVRDDVGVVFGNVIYTNGRRTWKRSFHWVSRRTLLHGDLCHQAVFARRRLFFSHGLFDATLKINADYDWLLKIFRDNVPTVHLERDIAVFFQGGAHTRDPEFQRRERHDVRMRYCRRGTAVIGQFALRLELKIRRILGQAV